MNKFHQCRKSPSPSNISIKHNDGINIRITLDTFDLYRTRIETITSLAGNPFPQINRRPLLDNCQSM